ncbi:hypothetical protein CVS40_4822 [Lucilia cuprina]|nr:hypothetical protein CVS40_4822 [Lucilia cuprina]
MEVGTLASVVDNASRVQHAIGKNILVKEKDVLGESSKLPQPLNIGEGSDFEFSDNNNNTIIANPKKDEVERMVKEESDNIAKLPITKKRLYGAQRKKLQNILQEIIVNPTIQQRESGLLKS